MREKSATFSQFVLRIVRSPRFFYAIVILLVFQALWIALTARYPQAFDENYHFGLIQLHAAQWLPYFTHQPPGSAAYGALAHDPSYLYHFLLSIPYRIIESFTTNQTVQIILLRLINIALFAWGLFVYRKLFKEIKIGTGMRNVVLFAFVLLPVVPLLAAQINYDNLMVPMTGLLFIYVTRYIQKMRDRRTSGALVSVWLLLQIAILGALGCIVKFTFVPVFLGVILVVVASTIFYYRIARIKPKVFGTGLAVSDKRAPLKLALLGVAAAIVIGLCLERYGVNMVAYQSPVPKCDKVLSIDDCQQYSPWARDFLFANLYSRPSLQGYLVYPFVWVNRMIFETLFTITSYIYEPWGTVTYSAFSPLMIGWVTSWVVVGVGAIGSVVYWRRIRSNRALTSLLLISAFYAFVLFVQNFLMYRHTGEGVAIHGRYLIPIYPILIVCLAMGWKGLLERVRLTRYQGLILVALTLLFLQGGGITNWLRRSDPSWYWQQNQAAQTANKAVKTIIDPVLYQQVSVPPR